MIKPARSLFLALLLGGAAAAGAHGAVALESRPPTEAERAAFFAYYQKQFPDNIGITPVFAIRRAPGDTGAWLIGASVDLAPRRGLKQLCRARHAEFAIAPGDKGWSEAGPGTQFAWLDSGTACRRPAQPVHLRAPMPDTELVSVLGQQARILERARLLMAGNSACAALRSSKFALATVDIGASGSSPEEMVALGFRSGEHGATVWVRRTGAEYDPWNVSCGPAPR